MNTAFITICIPAYKRIGFLKRLLDSIAIQDYKDFDVVITDDSPGQEVEDLCCQYKDGFKVSYFKNRQVLGTPENWNEAIRKAKGKWIKLMHDDDWFSNAGSLRHFAKAAVENVGAFIFSSYTNHFFSSGKEVEIAPSAYRLSRFRNNPDTILSRNLVGPPSVVLHRNDGNVWYDHKIKWLVDIDFYIRRMQFDIPLHIKEHLVHVGLGEEQVTMLCHQNPDIEIPESLYLLKKRGTKKLQSIMVYDAWWRLFRNLSISNEDHLHRFAESPLPEVLLRILKDQRKWPERLLQTGIISKLAMTISYLKNYRNIT